MFRKHPNKTARDLSHDNFNKIIDDSDLTEMCKTLLKSRFLNEIKYYDYKRDGVKKYYDTLNTSIFSTIHYLNYFEHSEPEIGQVSRPAETHRIRTVGMLDMKNLEEKWIFDLDIDRELCYYMCINEKRLKEEGGLHRKLVNILKEKPRNAFRKISYAIYETPLQQDFGFCVAHTNAIQKNS